MARYEKHYGRADFLKGQYPKFVEERIAKIRQELRLGRRFEVYVPPEDPGEPQLLLFS